MPTFWLAPLTLFYQKFLVKWCPYFSSNSVVVNATATESLLDSYLRIILLFFLARHCIKHTSITVFADLYFPIRKKQRLEKTNILAYPAQKMKFSIKNFLSKCNDIYWRNPKRKTLFFVKWYFRQLDWKTHFLALWSQM